MQVEPINKVAEGRPHIVDAIKNGEVQLVVNTTEGEKSLADSKSIRRTTLEMKVPYYTTLAGAEAAVRGDCRFGNRGIDCHQPAGLCSSSVKIIIGEQKTCEFCQICEN